MVVNDLNVPGIAALPSETDPPLVVDPNTKHHVLGEKLSNQGLPVGESQEPSDRSTSERVGDVKEHGAYPTLLLVGALTVDLDPYGVGCTQALARSDEVAVHECRATVGSRPPAAVICLVEGCPVDSRLTSGPAGANETRAG